MKEDQEMASHAGSKPKHDLSWTPPSYSVDEYGKVVGYVNERQPNNWGRWGEHDQRGTVNFLTPEIVRDAAGLIQTGEIISCAAPLDATGPVHPTRNGMTHFYAYTGADFVAGTIMGQQYPNFQGTDDYVIMATQASTQWDGLSHFAYADSLFNGFWLGNVESISGANRCSIQNMNESLCGRGVFLDVARHKGVKRLEQGYGIMPEELDEVAAAEGVEVREGDILILRTGHVPWFYELSPGAEKLKFFEGAPGISAKCVDWIYEKSIAAIAVDNVAVEVEPFEDTSEGLFPVHKRLIRDLGVSLGEIWHLEKLSEDCANDGRYEFFVAAQPLNITNGSGSPLNPIAIK
jgi:kynurenine formamidase